jgi:hypothetical protein
MVSTDPNLNGGRLQFSPAAITSTLFAVRQAAEIEMGIFTGDDGVHRAAGIDPGWPL